MGLDFLDPADDLAGENYGDQGIDDPGPRNIAEGETQDSQIADQVDPLDGRFQNVAQAHGQGVVAAGGAADPDTDTGADADEKSANESCQQGIVADLRPQGREQLAEGIRDGKTSGGNDRIADEGFSQGTPA